MPTTKKSTKAPLKTVEPKAAVKAASKKPSAAITAKTKPTSKPTPPAKKASAEKTTIPVAAKKEKPAAVVKPTAKEAEKPASKPAMKPVKAAPAVEKPTEKVATQDPAVKKVPKKPKKSKAPAPVLIKKRPSNLAKRPAPQITEDEPTTPKTLKLVRPVPAAPAAKKAIREESKPIKMPSIKATGSVPYDPDFSVSVLDTPKEEPTHSTPTMRYSDSELAEFRELIHRKLESARKELSYLHGLITRKDDMGGDNDDNRYMTMEDGSLSMEREQLSQMASRQITFIDHLEKALIRIENKTYGICRVTGKLIDKARLRAVPHATLSMEAKTSKNRVN